MKKGAEGASVSELERIYRDGFAAFVRVAHGITRDRETAVDAVQETFASALRTRNSYRGEGPLEAWLWRSLVHNALKSRPRPPLAVVPDEPSISAPESSSLADPIRRLPERQRLVLFLRYYADLDYRAIADLLGIEVGTVSATLSAAHTHMRSAIEEAR
jgi:RNA polymerase sigma-70 factor (ECF subfamily)